MSASDASSDAAAGEAKTPEDALGFCLADVVRSKQEVASLPADATVEHALALLAERRVLSAPVRREAGGAAAEDPAEGGEGTPFAGVVSVWDLAAAVCFQPLFAAYDDEKMSRGVLSEEAVDEALRLDVFGARALDVVGLSDESRRVWVREWSDSLGATVELFAKGVHRVLVRGERAGPADERGFRYLSQSDAVRFLVDALLDANAADPMLGQPVAELHRPGGDRPPLVTASVDNSALTCFRKMTMHGLSALPVVDAEGRLVASVSSSDLRGIGRATFKNTLLPVLEYLAVVQAGGGAAPGPREPVWCGPTEPLARAAALARQHRVHRVWVCDPETRAPVGVVSLTDVLRSFYGVSARAGLC